MVEMRLDDLEVGLETALLEWTDGGCEVEVVGEEVGEALARGDERFEEGDEREEEGGRGRGVFGGRGG